MRLRYEKKISLVISFLFGILSIVFIGIFAERTKDQMTELREVVQPFLMEGVYGEDRIPFHEISEIKVEDSSPFIIEGHMIQPIEAGQEVFIFLYQNSMEILVNGEKAFQSGDFYGTRWEFWKCPGISSSDKIEIVMSAKNRRYKNYIYEETLNNLGYGSRHSLLLEKISENRLQILLGITEWLAGISFLVHCIIYPILKIDRRRSMIPCSLFICFCSMSAIIDGNFMTLFFPYPAMINLLEVILQVVIILSILCYLRYFLRSRTWRIVLDVMILMGGIHLQIFYYVVYARPRGGVGVMEDMMSFHAMILILATILVIVDGWKTRKKSEQIILLSCFFMALMIIVEIYLFMMRGRYYVMILLCGLLVFSCIQVGLAWFEKKESSEMAKRAEKLERELLASRVSQLSSQIRPHFVYNMLTTIAGLIAMDREAAENATIEFAEYLRGNVDAMSSEKMIPFEKELEQLHHYLKLEKIRFDGKFKWIEEIEQTDFRIPAFSVEPLVENAIKHCVGMKKEILTVKLVVTVREDRIEIMVEDDGQGFDPNEMRQDGRSHMGIHNVRQRIELLVKGSFSIESELGKGTKAYITIPVEGKVTT